MINQNNFKQKIFEFAEKKYGDKFDEYYDTYYDEFPYKYYKLDDDELYFKNFLDWLLIEKPLPQTGMTIVEEFVKENPDIPNNLKQSILKMKNFIRGDFIVISILGPEIIIKHMDTDEVYNVLLYDTMDPDLFKEGRQIHGRIHEFDDKYRFCGAFTVKKTYLEDYMARIDREETIKLAKEMFENGVWQNSKEFLKGMNKKEISRHMFMLGVIAYSNYLDKMEKEELNSPDEDLDERDEDEEEDEFNDEEDEDEE